MTHTLRVACLQHRCTDSREANLETTAAMVPALTDRVKSLHSYECPCVVSLEIDGGHQPFLDWIAAGVSP